jgi:hypothetical protein
MKMKFREAGCEDGKKLELAEGRVPLRVLIL